jgi:hypothetical protein
MSLGFGCVAPRRYQFSSPQSTLRSTRSLTAQKPDLKKIGLDETHKVGLKVKDDNDYFEASSGAVPNLTRGSSNEGYSQQGFGPGPTDRSYLGKLRHNLRNLSTDSSVTTAGTWTVAEDYPLMKSGFRRKSFGHFSKEEAPSPSSPHLEQLRFRKQEVNGELETESANPSPNIHTDHPTLSYKYLEPEIPATPTLPPTPAGVTSNRNIPASKSFPSPSGLLMYLPPTCTMSEFHGGIPSLLTHEIVAFVSRIDNFDVTWRR